MKTFFIVSTILLSSAFAQLENNNFAQNMTKKIMQRWDSLFEDKINGHKNVLIADSALYSLKSSETIDEVRYEITLEPGVSGESVEVTVEKGLVTISGSKKEVSEEGDVYFSSSSSFSQSFNLPSYVDEKKVRIQHKDKGQKILIVCPKFSKEV